MGEGENTVKIRFKEREMTAAMIEGVVNSLRAALREDQAPVQITIKDGIQFDTGSRSKSLPRSPASSSSPGDVIQED